MTLALLMILLFSVILTSLHLLVVLLLAGGDWHAPDGTRVSGTDVPGVTRTRDPMVVRLRRTSGTPPEGMYRCTIEDATSTFQIVYVGLYNTGEGI